MVSESVTVTTDATEVGDACSESEAKSSLCQQTPTRRARHSDDEPDADDHSDATIPTSNDRESQVPVSLLSMCYDCVYQSTDIAPCGL